MHLFRSLCYFAPFVRSFSRFTTIMKRGRTFSNTERSGTELGEFSHILINYSGPSFSDLPMDVLLNFLLRLSMKRIVVCKLVCKTWHDLISKPEFAKFHFDQAQACPLVQISGDTAWSRTLYLVEPEEKDFELKLEICDRSEYQSKCDCITVFQLDTRFKLPLLNPQMTFDGEDCRPNMQPHAHGEESNNFMKLRIKDHKYKVVNSCNGLICLSRPYDNELCVVCNPVTGEFVELPEAKKVSSSRVIMLCGFGFGPSTNQYKVIRIFQCHNRDGGIGAQVHTLGTKIWKDVKVFAEVRDGLLHTYNNCLKNPTYNNGFLFWAYAPYGELSLCLLSFDITHECFGSILVPPIQRSAMYYEPNLGVLGGELSISCLLCSGVIEVWVMKNYGATKVWSKKLSIRSDSTSGPEIWSIGQCQPIMYLNDGALLMFSSLANSLIYKHPKKHSLRYFKFCGMKAQSEAIAHIPSFVSLKEALSGHDVNVHNVESSCAKLKLQDEDNTFLW